MHCRGEQLAARFPQRATAPGLCHGSNVAREAAIWELCSGAVVLVTLRPWLPMLQLCQVTTSLLISNARAACDEELLAREGVTFCINVTRQQPFPSLQQVQGIRIPVFDDPAEDLYRYFEQCSNAIEEAVKSGGKCLVYCKNGRSRSAAICTAYLMRHRKLTLKDAFEVLYLYPDLYLDILWVRNAMLIMNNDNFSENYFGALPWLLAVT